MDEINMCALTTAKFSIRRGGTSSKRSEVMSAMCESDATIEVNLETERSSPTLTTEGRDSNSSGCLETRTASTSGSYERSATTISSSSIGEIRTASASPCPLPAPCPIVAQRQQKPPANSSLADILGSVSRSPSHRAQTPQPEPKPCVRIAVPERTPQHPKIINTHTLHLDGSASTPLPQQQQQQAPTTNSKLVGIGVFDYDSSEDTITDDSRGPSRSVSVKTESTVASNGVYSADGVYSDAGSPPPPRRSASSRRSNSSKAASSLATTTCTKAETRRSQVTTNSKPTRSCSAGTSRSTATTRRKMYFGAAERQWQIAREREWVDPKKIRHKGIIPDARQETVSKRVFGNAAEEEEIELFEQFHNQHQEEDINVDEIVSRLHPKKSVVERKQRELQELYHPQPTAQPARVKVDINRLARPPKREVCNYAGYDNNKEFTFKPKTTKHFVTESENYSKYMGPVWQRLTKPKKQH